MESINWSDLGFGYIKTDYNVRCYYRDGKWGELEVTSSEIINLPAPRQNTADTIQ